MNNEEKILSLLEQVAARLEIVETNLTKTREDQSGLCAQIAQMREEINQRFDLLEANMKYAWQDIAFVEKRIKQHEKEFHNVG